jgi:hypothetical protein
LPEQRGACRNVGLIGGQRIGAGGKVRRNAVAQQPRGDGGLDGRWLPSGRRQPWQHEAIQDANGEDQHDPERHGQHQELARH